MGRAYGNRGAVVIRVVHDNAVLLQRGYVRLEEPLTPDLPGFCTMQRLHHKYDVKWSGIAAFRLAEGWAFYRHPKAEAGFVDGPILPAVKS